MNTKFSLMKPHFYVTLIRNSIQAYEKYFTYICFYTIQLNLKKSLRKPTDGIIYNPYLMKKKVNRLLLYTQKIVITFILVTNIGCMKKATLTMENPRNGNIEHTDLAVNNSQDGEGIDYENTENRESFPRVGSASPVQHPKDGSVQIVAKSSGKQIEEKIKPDDYKVILEVNERIKTHERATLRVWIGIGPKWGPHLGKVQDSTTIPVDIGQYAKITPFAPGFDIEPNTAQCIKLDRSGAEVVFSLTPQKQGAFEVSANIDLYEESGCTGTPVPKRTAILTVHVDVDGKHLITDKAGELTAVAWDKFLNFWGLLLTLVFGMLLFLIRRNIKRKTGYEDTPLDT